MAGGIFTKSSPKVRPGVYVNVINGKQPTAASSPIGVAILPLIGYDWGKRGEMIKITQAGPDAHMAELGRSVYSDNAFMRMIQMILLNATTCYVYIPAGGTAATGTLTIGEATVTMTAKYPGTFGNKIKVGIAANPVEGFDVTVYVDGAAKEVFEGLTTASELTDSDYVVFSGTANLAAVAAVSLSNGADAGADAAAAGLSAFLDAAEKVRFNTMCAPVTVAAQQAAVMSKIRYIRNTLGWKCQAVVPNYAADYEGIINVTNSFKIDGEDQDISVAAAWLCGARAGAGYSTSLTYKIVTVADGLVGELSNEAAEAALKAGKCFFSLDENGRIILEQDINSKITFNNDDPLDINKNRPMKVYDTFANDLLVTFRPNAFDNNPTGWDAIEGIGRGMLQNYEADNAIQNVDTEADFKVDRESSTGDSVYINVALQAVDSAEKYYFTVVAK